MGGGGGGGMFLSEVEGYIQKLISFGRGKKIRPKKSLTWLLHKALQLKCGHVFI